MSGGISPPNSTHGLYNVASSAIAPVDRSSTPLNLDLNDLFGDDELAVLTGVYSGEIASKKRDKASTLTVSRRKKKPKGFPKRPLSGYNIFFKQERVSVLEEHSAELLSTADDGFEGDHSERTNVSFQDLGKIIGKRWKALTDDQRKKFEFMAHDDSLRYRNEMEVFNESKRKYNEDRIMEATTGYRDEKSYSKWGSDVIAGVPELKPLAQQNQPLQARLPGGRKDPPQPRQNPRQDPQLPQGALGDAFSAPYAQQGDAWRQNHPVRQSDVPPPDTGVCYSIPPGTELYLPDPQGRERKFKVHYKFYSMSRQAAETYMEHLSTTAVATPFGFTEYPPPPAPPPNGNPRDSHYPFWS